MVLLPGLTSGEFAADSEYLIKALGHRALQLPWLGRQLTPIREELDELRVAPGIGDDGPSASLLCKERSSSLGEVLRGHSGLPLLQSCNGSELGEGLVCGTALPCVTQG